MSESRQDIENMADTGQLPADSRSSGSREYNQNKLPYLVDRANIDLDIVNALVKAGAVLFPEVRARITSQGISARGNSAQPSTVVASLLAVAAGAYESEQAHPWWAPMHALSVLRDLDDPACIEPLLDLLVHTVEQDKAGEDIVDTLCAMGAPALEPTLRVYAATTDSDRPLRVALATILARSQVRDERIFPVLVEVLQHSMDEGWSDGAVLLADYGDPQAISYLNEAFDSYDTGKHEDPYHAKQVLFAVETALVRLGASITDEQRSRYEGLESARLLRYSAEREREKQREKEQKAIQKKRRSNNRKKRKQQKNSRKKNR